MSVEGCQVHLLSNLSGARRDGAPRPRGAACICQGFRREAPPKGRVSGKDAASM